MDFDVSVFIITSDKQYIPIDEFVNNLDGDAVFVMLTNDELNTEFGDDNSVCIYKEWAKVVHGVSGDLKRFVNFDFKYGYVSCPWQTGQVQVSDMCDKSIEILENVEIADRERHMRMFLDGLRMNREIMMKVSRVLAGNAIVEYIPAIMAAHHANVCLAGQKLRGYLPAPGQLLYIDKNISLVNDALDKIGGNDAMFVVDAEHHGMYFHWWSAMEVAYNAAWGMNKRTIFSGRKTDPSAVLPLFVI